jgi:hypothetical protein
MLSSMGLFIDVNLASQFVFQPAHSCSFAAELYYLNANLGFQNVIIAGDYSVCG